MPLASQHVSDREQSVSDVQVVHLLQLRRDESNHLDLCKVREQVHLLVPFDLLQVRLKSEPEKLRADEVLVLLEGLVLAHSFVENVQQVVDLL